MELPEPVLSDESRRLNVTNEGGVDATVRYLKNIMGLWILSEAIRTWEAEGKHHSAPELAQAAKDVRDAPTFDATHGHAGPGQGARGRRRAARRPRVLHPLRAGIAGHRLPRHHRRARPADWPRPPVGS
ncbi:hypothetical protein [Tessaracoccus massiliensis]|uniref:hypothetical protein n=1 Tax=Tessaracoccus massiliensis TaxID=1522311 RepID=UPI00111B5900|nr:hypothetical protein [Tessaracoccus massiliensis]